MVVIRAGLNSHKHGSKKPKGPPTLLPVHNHGSQKNPITSPKNHSRALSFMKDVGLLMVL
jgi:hypothetical protein